MHNCCGPGMQVRMLALQVVADFAGRSKLFRKLLAGHMNKVLLLCVGHRSECTPLPCMHTCTLPYCPSQSHSLCHTCITQMKVCFFKMRFSTELARLSAHDIASLAGPMGHASVCRLDTPLPGPPTCARALRDAALDCVRVWHEKYGKQHPQVGLGYEQCACADFLFMHAKSV